MFIVKTTKRDLEAPEERNNHMGSAPLERQDLIFSGGYKLLAALQPGTTEPNYVLRKLKPWFKRTPLRVNRNHGPR